jgi:uncharacterized PurR-regulated membrane protein YhhQ (DUF165 family)
MILVVLYVLTIPLANWLLGHVGTICPPGGPCLIPVAPGLLAPSGVPLIGVALVLRDLVQRRFGAVAGLACIAAGTLISFTLAPPAIAIASATAFVFSELVDFGIYTPLARRHFVLAVVASVVLSGVVDSALFLTLAFGSLDHLLGQVVGKAYAAIAFAAWRLTADRMTLAKAA